MNCWEILEIEPTTDLKVIKTAYAAKAKEWHPEEHPDEFQRLQQAYRDAVRMVKLNQTNADKNIRPVLTVMGNRQDAESQKNTKVLKTAVSPVNKERLAEEAATEKEKLPRVIIEKGKLSEEETEQAKFTAKEPVDRQDARTQSQNSGYEDNRKQLQNVGNEEGHEPVQNVGNEEGREPVQNASNEEGHEQQPNHAHEDIGEQSQDFDYEEVAKADLKDRFFGEFFSIAWNPYLMNNLACWEYILNRASYEQLLSDPTFRRNFVLTVCHQLTGWQRGTMLLFEKWLHSHPANDADKVQKKETDLLCWKFRKIGFFGKLLPSWRCATKEQKELHEIFLTQVARSGMDTNLKSEEDVKCYLSFYLPYAAGKQSRIKQLYHGSIGGRAMFTSLLLMVPVIIGMMIYTQVSVVPHLRERKAEEVEQRQIQQKAEELRLYNELLELDDPLNAPWLEEYYDELRQKTAAEREAFLEEFYKLYPEHKP